MHRMPRFEWLCVRVCASVCVCVRAHACMCVNLSNSRMHTCMGSEAFEGTLHIHIQEQHSRRGARPAISPQNS